MVNLLSDCQETHHRVAVFEGLGFLPGRHQFQRIAARVTQYESPVRRQQLRQIGVVEQLLRE